MTDPISRWTLEDWVTYYSAHCTCHGEFHKCSGCTIRELEASWRKTLEAERATYRALNERFARCQKALADAHSRS